MKKVQAWIKEKKGYFFSFLIPFFCLILLFASLRVLFFHKYVSLVSDMKVQYYSLFLYLKEFLEGKHTIFYSFQNGMGGNMFGVFTYYLLSPFNLLVLLFSRQTFHYVMLFIPILKISLSGFTMYYFLRKHSSKASDLFSLAFSTSYALMSYNICYYFNFMWLDSVYLLPLMCLGIDRLVERNEIKFYSICLFLGILFNYYMGYMMCLFSIIYFFYSLFLKYRWKSQKKKMLSITLTYAITSCLVGFSCMFVLLPSLFNMFSTSKSVSGTFQEGVSFLSLHDLFSKIYIGSHTYANVLGTGGPILYVGMFSFVLLLLYFLNTKIQKREKILSGIVVLLFLLSFDVNYFNYLWHGLNVPSFFNHRFSSFFCFFILFLAQREFSMKEGHTRIHYFFVASILPVFSLYMVFQKVKYLSYLSIYLSVALYLFYVFFLNIFPAIKKRGSEKEFSLLLFSFIVAELFCNSYLCLYDFQFFPVEENYDYVITMNSKIEPLRETNHQTFYRVEKDFQYTALDSFLYGYHGVSSFLSTIPESVITFWGNLGYNRYNNAVHYTAGFPPMLDSVLGIRYFVMKEHPYFFGNEISSFEFSKYDGYLHGMFMQNYKIYENSYAMGIGFMTSSDYKRYDDTSVQGQPTISVQQLLFESMLGTEDCVLKATLPKQISSNVYEVAYDNDFIYYFDYLKEPNDKIKRIYLNDILYYQFSKEEFTAFTIPAGSFPDSDTITIRFEYSDGSPMNIFNLVFYSFDESLFESQISKLKEHELQIEKIEDGYLKGHVSVEEDMPILFLSIPNEDGWQLKVDGVKTEIMTIYDTFMGIYLTPGDHDIELSFTPPGLKLGIFLSFLSGFLFYSFCKKRKNIVSFFTNLYFNHEEVWNYLIVGGLTTVINVFVYAIFTKAFHISYLNSTIFAWFLSVLFAYFANKFLVFKKKTRGLKKLWEECLKFFEFRIASLLMEVVLMYVFVSILHFSDLLCKILVNIFVIIVNYFFSKLLVFKKQ